MLVSTKRKKKVRKNKDESWKEGRGECLAVQRITERKNETEKINKEIQTGRKRGRAVGNTKKDRNTDRKKE